MKNILSQLLDDFQERNLPELVTRNVVTDMTWHISTPETDVKLIFFTAQNFWSDTTDSGMLGNVG